MWVRICTITLFTLMTGLADDWPAPSIREIFSPSRSHFVRVIPGSNWDETYGFRGAQKGPFAQAEFFGRQPDGSYQRLRAITLVNPVAPVDFFVTNRGDLVTLDNWHNKGYGKVVVFYRLEGKVTQAYELPDLFSTDEVNGFDHSMSSIQWRSQAYLNPDGRSLFLQIREGTDVTFDIPSGAYQVCENSGGRYVCRHTNRRRVWGPFRGAP